MNPDSRRVSGLVDPVTFCFRWALRLRGCLQVPKSGDQSGQNPAEACVEVLGAMKQVSYKTEIIGGVPIITTTQVSYHQDFNNGRTFFKIE